MEKLIQDFQRYRSLVLKKLYKQVRKAPNKTLFLKNNPLEFISNGEVWKKRYSKLFFKKYDLYIEYTTINNFRCTDPIEVCGMDEIYEILLRIK